MFRNHFDSDVLTKHYNEYKWFYDKWEYPIEGMNDLRYGWHRFNDKVNGRQLTEDYKQMLKRNGVSESDRTNNIDPGVFKQDFLQRIIVEPNGIIQNGAELNGNTLKVSLKVSFQNNIRSIRIPISDIKALSFESFDKIQKKWDPNHKISWNVYDDNTCYSVEKYYEKRLYPFSFFSNG